MYFDMERLHRRIMFSRRKNLKPMPGVASLCFARDRLLRSFSSALRARVALSDFIANAVAIVVS
jgi:hypothetical protein